MWLGTRAVGLGLIDGLADDEDTALEAAVTLAHQLAALPQFCLRSDRLSALEQWGLTEADAAVNEARRGRQVINSGETLAGARRFAGGAGRGGSALT